MLQHYPVESLIALLKSIEGSKDFFKWLLENGYPELAAFSNAVRGDEEALRWLLKNKQYAVLGVLSNAIDGEANAVNWIKNYNDPFLIHFAGACRQSPAGVQWLVGKQQQLFLTMAQEIKKVLDTQAKENTFWYKFKF